MISWIPAPCSDLTVMKRNFATRGCMTPPITSRAEPWRYTKKDCPRPAFNQNLTYFSVVSGTLCAVGVGWALWRSPLICLESSPALFV